VSSPNPPTGAPNLDDWRRLRVRVGTILEARPNTGARDLAYALHIDFGDLGVLQSSAKITERYKAEDLVGRRVVAVTGLPPLRVGGYRSDVLVLGALTDGGTVLLEPDSAVPPGSVVA